MFHAPPLDVQYGQQAERIALEWFDELLGSNGASHRLFPVDTRGDRFHVGPSDFKNLDLSETGRFHSRISDFVNPSNNMIYGDITICSRGIDVRVEVKSSRRYLNSVSFSSADHLEKTRAKILIGVFFPKNGPPIRRAITMDEARERARPVNNFYVVQVGERDTNLKKILKEIFPHPFSKLPFRERVIASLEKMDETMQAISCVALGLNSEAPFFQNNNSIRMIERSLSQNDAVSMCQMYLRDVNDLLWDEKVDANISSRLLI